MFILGVVVLGIVITVPFSVLLSIWESLASNLGIVGGNVRTHSQPLGIVGPSFSIPNNRPETNESPTRLDDGRCQESESMGLLREHDFNQPGVISFSLRIPILMQARLQEFDLHNESLFLQKLYTALTSDSLLTEQAIVRKVELSIVKFGQRVFFWASIPDEFVTDFGLIQ
jgi:hypothetical protein